ncbi:putative YbaK/aminoacyl-tRNA synthetase-associated domain [Magnetospirillum sp. LM-5]|uniref:prolyl-tRNA synthetase associated domain-containing protein n=1 Tax=Magnetospirillum sp. LM-5 TaxID=2681466 RepID=UPI001383D5A9|nr:prolyl-tRNA synthetase associated domain-containing protein [Magnetospirillum sp. LM-5]CAA7625954.1 putative YbaK/aminoacyl-tRNA synthetase-associated domain [Magnetospirillum sp. LM-5]
MPLTPEALLAHLGELGITVTTHRHAPAFTVEQGNEVWGNIPGIHCKNLFLKDGKGRLWLVVAPADKRIDLKRLPGAIGAARLSFGSAELLGEVLGVEPGSVTPFALINDQHHRVTPVLDSWMMDQPLLNYHPLRNDMTTTIASADFRRFLAATGHRPEILLL